MRCGRSRRWHSRSSMHRAKAIQRRAQGPRRRARGPRLSACGAVVLAFALSPQLSALRLSLSQEPSKPIIVSIPKDPPTSELSGLADVLLGSLGLTGVIVIAAVLMGALMAGVMFWIRSRQT